MQELDIRCFGCQTIHYTLDGSIPTQDSPAFQTLIDLSQDTSLKFIIVDAEDNVGTVESAEYIIDLKKPELSIQFPTENSIIENIYEFKGTALDPKTSSGSGIERLELTVTNGDFYLTNDPENPLSTTPALLNIIHTGDNWTHKLVTDTLPSGHYTIEARLYDKLGNESQEMVNFMIGKPIFTTLTLDTDKSKILQKDTISITGKLRYFPASQDIDLSGLPILLNITDPDGIQQPPQILHTDAYGNYAPTDIDSFHKAGSYSLQTAFMGQDFFVEAHTKTSHVFVGQSAGYAMLVQGRVSNNEGMEAYNKSLNRIYRTLLDREFTAQDIIYFNYNAEQEGVDARPSKTNIQNHLGKIQTYLNEVAAPFYLLMLDHGSYERFMLGEEEISPQELNAWLTELEAGLNPAALAQPRIIILGACFSGSFISELSKPGRIIISSAAEDEYSYKGLHEADGIRSGEYFIDSLFRFLGKGLNIKTAFTQATQATEHFTHHRSLSANAQNRFNDSAVQHPLLDDNGDAKGSNTFYLNQDEGKYAETVILGAGADYDVSFDGNPAEIQAINDTLFLSSTDTEGPLWLTVNDMRKVEKALIEIRKPADIASLTQRPNATGQSILMLEKRFLSPNLDTNRYEVTYKEFIEPGRYDIFYYVQDATTYKNDPVTGQVIYAGDISTAWQGVVYKNKVNNNPPNLFNLTSPKDNAEIPSFALFDWESSVDPDGNKLTYTLLISDMEDFSSPVYQQTLLDISATIVTDAAQLQDGKNYYWQVWAVDAFGAKMESQIHQFTINNPSVPPGGLSPSIEGDFNLNSSVTLTPVHNVQQTTQDGKQLFVAPAGEYQASFTNGIGETQTIPVTLQSDVVTQVNLWAGQATASFNFSDLSLTIPLIRIDMPHPHWFAADFVYTGTGFVLRNVNPVKPNNILSYVPLDLADINLVSIVKILDRPGLPLYRLGLSLLPESSSDFHFEITMLEPIALQ
ncbi:chitobiase/beta-hexosaminidase C-terminal domain-containing protein [Candidatus Venteria ishoeyi]|uniref:chitobiase/beta-hexosaminidase C-terminal domain-containing protein n=1 Tax=Candidatus Venteria ishoeyi TaxID=1899563 RepID=UPI002A4E2BC9|nr:chitobiase/beta-hexosaminidase C-terminal domain-containing protein [Candidatus Venteria ishoeyi]